MTIVRRDGYVSIGSYGLLADGCGSALVAADGSIDWLAEPTVDAPPLLARLVDRGSGGHFVLRPSVDYEAEGGRVLAAAGPAGEHRREHPHRVQATSHDAR